MFPRRFFQLLAPIWIAFVLAGSLLPGKQRDVLNTRTPYAEATRGEIRWQHRGLHYLAFGGTALLLGLTARSHSGRIYAFIATTALGMGIEVAQKMTPGNSMEWWDVRDDTSAALLATALIAVPRLRIALVRP